MPFTHIHWVYVPQANLAFLLHVSILSWSFTSLLWSLYKSSCGTNKSSKSKQPIHHKLQVLIAWFSCKTNPARLKYHTLKRLSVPQSLLLNNWSIYSLKSFWKLHEQDCRLCIKSELGHISKRSCTIILCGHWYSNMCWRQSQLVQKSFKQNFTHWFTYNLHHSIHYLRCFSFDQHW